MKGQKWIRKPGIPASTPLENWPTEDRVLFERCLREHSPFEEGGRGASWRDATRHKYIYDYGRWITWLSKTHPQMLALTPADRVSQNMIEAYRQHLASIMRPHSVAAHLSGLGSMLWAMYETDKFAWVQLAAQRLARRAIARDKRPLMHSSHELAQIGFELMNEADAGQRLGYRPPAVRYRNGLMIALLAYWPIRRRNLASIEIGRHLRECETGYHIDFTADETKQKRAISFLTPTALTFAIERYLSVHRPVLMALKPYSGRAGKALWVGADGDRLNAAGIHRAITEYTAAKIGHALSPHRFRDCAATTIATEDPGHVEDIKAVLGHGSLATSERHYNQAGSIEAARSYHAVLRKLRKQRGDNAFRPLDSR